MSVQSEAPAVLSLADLTPEQFATLMAQAAIKARDDIAHEAQAKKEQNALDKKAREERALTLSAPGQTFAEAVFVAVDEHETNASIAARDEAKKAGKALPDQKFTRTFTTRVTIDGKTYTLGGYLSLSSKQK